MNITLTQRQKERYWSLVIMHCMIYDKSNCASPGDGGYRGYALWLRDGPYVELIRLLTNKSLTEEHFLSESIRLLGKDIYNSIIDVVDGNFPTVNGKFGPTVIERKEIDFNAGAFKIKSAEGYSVIGVTLLEINLERLKMRMEYENLEITKNMDDQFKKTKDHFAKIEESISV